MSYKAQKNDRRWVAKILEKDGEYGRYQKVIVDNPLPTLEDGTPNKYYRGSLLWIDDATGKKYLVKQLSIRPVHENSLKHGFINSVTIDLDSKYEVLEIKQDE